MIAVQTHGCPYFEQTHWPPADDRDSRFADSSSSLTELMCVELGIPPAPVGYDEDGIMRLAKGANTLRESTDKAIVGVFGGSLYELS